ncbi:MAG: hypothetical protein H7841_11820 [Magnetospirillum sp. WYHS-4]
MKGEGHVPHASPACRQWQAHLRAAAHLEELKGHIRQAVDELIPPGVLPTGTRSEIVNLFLDAITRSRDFSTAREKAVKALLPLSLLGQLVERQAPPEVAPVQPVEQPPGYQEKFESVFTDSLCQFLRERIEALHVPERGGSALPYPLSPTFGEIFIQAVAEHIAPTMLSARRISLLAQSIPFEDLRPETFYELFLRPERENVVLFLWDDRWSHIQTLLTKAGGARAADKGKNRKGLLGMFGGKDKKEAASPRDAMALHAEAFWEMLESHAGPDIYEAPRISDIPFLKVLFRYIPAQIREGQAGIRQMLAQENDKALDGREGSSRQYLCKLVRGLPAHCGELIALWAYFTCGSDFGPKILKGFRTSYGSGTEEQAKAIPFFARWTPLA